MSYAKTFLSYTLGWNSELQGALNGIKVRDERLFAVPSSQIEIVVDLVASSCILFLSLFSSSVVVIFFHTRKVKGIKTKLGKHEARTLPLLSIQNIKDFIDCKNNVISYCIIIIIIQFFLTVQYQRFGILSLPILQPIFFTFRFIKESTIWFLNSCIF